MPRVVHFEIHAEQPARAAKFYSALFDWKIEQWGAVEYWLVTTGPDDRPGINGGLLPRRGVIDGQAVIAYVCTVDVDNLDASVAQALTLGGQLALPKMAVPGMGWLAYCKDTEGNIFGMMQNDPSAR
jgi:hypothetical protein